MVNKIDMILVISLMFLVASLIFSLYNSLQALKFSKEDCKIFEKKESKIYLDLELCNESKIYLDKDGYVDVKFEPLDLELCNYCNVKC